ncbi:multicopper oxidase family protein [Campylobacter helveticus]|uniref:multicopper oxidase family protein n=1 Tax=Campylobacter helveticus TaxID=28898 RepID=UPI002149A87A|nr:multicopper oxidase family protein [Campylobacter helveticus]MCR2065968.1 multicopper oxidase family protein [Campylobacter helveticus]
MQRRTFLKTSTLALVSTSLSYAMPMHSNHTSHQNTPADTSFIHLAPLDLKLLDKKEFPANQALKPLNLLKNESKKKGYFKARIKITEEEIELIKGKKTKFYTYNASIPAPKIEVFEGDEVEIIVENHLKEPTTIHWHGLPVPPNQDGNPHDAILPKESRSYHFTLPQNCAGTYWYHPHPHYITSKQVFMGLSGAFVVKAKKDALSHFAEQDFMISDLRLDENAQIPHNNLYDWLNGREGEFVLINGQFEPKITLNNEKIRLYNCCSARYLRLRIKGAKFLLVGTDGGLLERGVEKEELFLSPASRAEVFILAPKGEFKLESLYYDRDKMLVKEEKKDLFLASVEIKNPPLEIPKELRKFKPLDEPKEFKEVILSEDHAKMHGIAKKTQDELKNSLASMFLLNGKIFDMKRVDFSSRVGEVEDWIIINKSHMDHPFHIHGTQFELISSKLNGKVQKAEFRALRDTINVRPKEELRLRMKQDFKGLRMYHCHILEHEDLGMMGNLELRE